MRAIIDMGFSGEATRGIPQDGVFCWLLCGEFGCTPLWYYGRVWQSREMDGSPTKGQPPQFYSYEGDNHPPFHLPEYLGMWISVEDFPIKIGE